MPLISRRAAVLSLILIPLAGCGGGGSPTAIGARRFGSLEFALTTPKTVYARGERVPLTFTVKNVGSRTVNVRIVGCFIYWGVWQGNQALGPCFGCADAAYTIPIAPGEIKTYSDSWTQTDCNVNPVPSGQYMIRAWLPASSVNGVVFTAQESLQTLAAIPIPISIH